MKTKITKKKPNKGYKLKNTDIQKKNNNEKKHGTCYKHIRQAIMNISKPLVDLDHDLI